MKRFDSRLLRALILIMTVLGLSLIIISSQKLGRYYEGKVTANPQEKLSNLIKSNFFAPGDNKKLQIISEYNELGYPEKGEYWIVSLKEPRYNFVKAGYYLERNNIQKANVYSKRIKDERLKTEINELKLYLEGQKISTESPVTDYGRFLNDEKVSDSYSFLATLGRKSQTSTDFAANLIENGYYKPALNILANLDENKHTLTLKAKALEKSGQTEEALEVLGQGVNKYPESIELLQSALRLSKNNKTLEERFQKRLDYMLSISR